jgi:catechol 2,3-dioxygenase-like lactoylglutathione lyase family enzyme
MVLQAYPNMPVRDIARSVAFYRDKVGLPPRHQEDGFAILSRDAVEVHLWQADDQSWRTRKGDKPMISGAESILAGTVSCRIRVEGVEELCSSLRPLGIVHGNAPLTDQPWGDRDFAILDPDGNLVTFFERTKDARPVGPEARP